MSNENVYFLCDSVLSFIFFFSSRRRHTRCLSDWSSDVCSSDLLEPAACRTALGVPGRRVDRLLPGPCAGEGLQSAVLIQKLRHVHHASSSPRDLGSANDRILAP